MIITNAHPHATSPQRRSPERTCVGCRRCLSSTAMVRCTLDHDGHARLGIGRGRGAWICSMECFERAARRDQFARAWRRSVTAQTITELGALIARAMEQHDSSGTLSGESLTEQRMTKG